MHQSNGEEYDQSAKAIYYGSLSEDIALPVLSFAPELCERGVAKFDEKTDVWAFGITLIELYQLGKPPYQHFQGRLNDIIRFVRTCGVHAKPKFCPDAVYALAIKACLSQKTDRPMITAVMRELRQLDLHNIQESSHFQSNQNNEFDHLQPSSESVSPQDSRNSVSSRTQIVSPTSNISEPSIIGNCNRFRESNLNQPEFNGTGDMYSPLVTGHLQSNQNSEFDDLQLTNGSRVDTSGYAVTHIPITARFKPHYIQESSI